MTSPSGPRVLVVEDELRLLNYVAAQLKSEGYQVEIARDGQEGLDKAALFQPELVVLDLGLPRVDGLEFLNRFREWSDRPVIVLSAWGEEQTKVSALDTGADDYLTKPFSVAELLARVRAALRRAVQQDAASPSKGEPVIRVGDLTIDLAARLVLVRNQEIKLTRTEYELLKYLTMSAGKLATHRELLRKVWGPEYGEEAEYLRTFIRQLRRKLETDPSRPRLIVTQPGVGYRFQLPETSASNERSSE